MATPIILITDHDLRILLEVEEANKAAAIRDLKGQIGKPTILDFKDTWFISARLGQANIHCLDMSKVIAVASANI